MFTISIYPVAYIPCLGQMRVQRNAHRICCATFRRYGNGKIINLGPLSAFACTWAIPRAMNNRLSYILRSLFSPSHPGSCSLVSRPLLPSLTTHSCLPSFSRLSHNNVFISILIGILSIHLMRSPPLGFFQVHPCLTLYCDVFMVALPHVSKLRYLLT